jgi:hypothetical protein
MILEKNGDIVQTGASGAVLGHRGRRSWLANPVAKLASVLAQATSSSPGALCGVDVGAGDLLQASFDGWARSVRFVWKNHGANRAAILGSGNIGTDLMYKLKKSKSPPSDHGRNYPRIEGWRGARQEDWRSAKASPDYSSNKTVSMLVSMRLPQARTKARANVARANKIAIDLTPAAVGPYVVPLVNLESTSAAQR